MPQDEKRFFSTPSLSGLLQQLKHLSLFSAEALVVEGANGSGKSTLLNQLFVELESDQHREVPLAMARLSLPCDAQLHDVLLGAIAQIGLDSEEGSIGALLARLRSYSEALVRERRVTLLLIDNAEQLEDDALGALLSLLQSAREGGFGLKILFFSEEGIAARIDLLELPDLTVYDFQLPEFSVSELGRFLAQRFEEFDRLIDEEKIPSLNSIWNRAAGSPGEACRIVESAMAVPEKNASTKEIARLPLLHVVVVALLVAALILTLLYRGGASDDSAESKMKREELQPQKTERRLITAESTVSAGPPEPTAATIISDAKSETGAPKEHTQVELSEALSEASTSENPVNTIVGSHPFQAGQDEAGGNDVVQNGAAASVLGREVSPEGERPAEKSEPEQGVQNSRAIKSPSRTSTDTLSEAETFLLAQPPGAYALQLVAASKPESLLAYREKQENKSNLHIYRRVKADGGQWYIVVIGPYVSKVQAQNALKTLPKQQREAGPWPKSMSAIHEEIEAFRSR